MGNSASASASDERPEAKRKPSPPAPVPTNPLVVAPALPVVPTPPKPSPALRRPQPRPQERPQAGPKDDHPEAPASAPASPAPALAPAPSPETTPAPEATPPMAQPRPPGPSPPHGGDERVVMHMASTIERLSHTNPRRVGDKSRAVSIEPGVVAAAPELSWRRADSDARGFSQHTAAARVNSQATVPAELDPRSPSISLNHGTVVGGGHNAGRARTRSVGLHSPPRKESRDAPHPPLYPRAPSIGLGLGPTPVVKARPAPPPSPAPAGGPGERDDSPIRDRRARTQERLQWQEALLEQQRRPSAATACSAPGVPAPSSASNGTGRGADDPDVVLSLVARMAAAVDSAGGHHARRSSQPLVRPAEDLTPEEAPPAAAVTPGPPSDEELRRPLPPLGPAPPAFLRPQRPSLPVPAPELPSPTAAGRAPPPPLPPAGYVAPELRRPSVAGPSQEEAEEEARERRLEEATVVFVRHWRTTPAADRVAAWVDSVGSARHEATEPATPGQRSPVVSHLASTASPLPWGALPVEQPPGPPLVNVV